MSELIFTAPHDEGFAEVRVGWHHDFTGEWSYFARVWVNGDEEREIADVGCVRFDPISSVKELRERLGEWAEVLPVDLVVPHDQVTELRFARVTGGEPVVMSQFRSAA